MLIRCEKCGEAFLRDVGKCPKCNEPIPEKPREVSEEEARLTSLQEPAYASELLLTSSTFIRLASSVKQSNPLTRWM